MSTNHQSPSVKKYLAEVEECLIAIDKLEGARESAKIGVETEHDYLGYLAQLMVTDAIDNIRTRYDRQAEEELFSTIWYLYWLMPQVKVVTIEHTLKESVGEILTKEILSKIKDKATINVQCSRCGKVSSVQIKSRTALKEANSPKPWKQPLCDDCEEIKRQENEEATQKIHEKWDKHLERLQELKAMPYQEYLQTEEWQQTRKAALKRARYRCQVCNSEGELHVHHRTYERRGSEYASDLIVLCKGCHETYHFPETSSA